MLHISLIQVIVLGLLQGITELFPISSLGHIVILPGLLRWGNIVQNKEFVPLVVALHLGTSIALVFYFWRDWLHVLQTIWHSLKAGEIETGSEDWITWLLIVGIIPAGLLGVFLEAPLKNLFAYPLIASIFLIINGIILLWAEALKKRTSTKTIPLASLSWKDATFIGIVQAFALLPGISRSGSSIVAGLYRHLNHEDAARFSFLLGTPVIAGAALIEIPQLFHEPQATLLLILLGAIIAAVAAYVSTKFLLKYFTSGDLIPFGYYCIGIGIIATTLFLTVLR